MTTTYGDEVAHVEEIHPGRLVRIGPARINVNDVLELAEALIEEHGHIKRDSGSAATGWSLHGAIGEAAKRAVAAHGKDSPEARPLRDAANEALMAAHGGRTDIQLNDEPRCTKRRAIRVLQHARGVGR